MPDLPSGTVTFLFTDVEGSTRLLRELGAEEYAETLAEHRKVVREACGRHNGVEVDTQGDAFFFAFPTAPGALAAAEAMTEALTLGPIQIRVGVHTGTPLLAEEGYVGDDVHRAARIAAAGHGGQVLISSSTERLVDLELRDLGEHRFKDLSAPERVFQLGQGHFPPLKTLHQTNVPIPQTPFLGREHELGEVRGLLERDDVRLLTLTGPGGTGKTRLATQAAGSVAERFPHGIFWVPLAALRDPALVLESAGQAVGATNGLAAHIADRKMLLLFDNFEQVVEAAPGLSTLLGECPQVQLLVTSRERLHLAGEQEYPVPPLSAEEGVGFFAARARAVKPDFEIDEAVSEICRRLDELPLALELAASRVKALSTEQILSRLDHRLPLLTGGTRDAPERQRTLRATIDWSYDLLADGEQQLFGRLSVFAGGCTLESAEQVCGADIETLQSLVEKSLLRFTNERYWMLETIREYAVEQLDSAAYTHLRDRHVEYFLVFAAREGELFRTVAQSEAIVRLAKEEHNLRLALTRLADTRPDRLLEFVSALKFYWTVGGRLAETRQWAERALEASPATASELRADALLFLAGVAHRAGDAMEATRRATEAVEMYEALHSPELGRAFVYLGNANSMAGRYEDAASAYEAAISHAVQAHDRHCEGLAASNLGYLMLLLEQYERAEGLFRDAVEIDRELGNHTGMTAALCNAGLAALRTLRLDEARELLGAAMQVSVDLGHRRFMASCLEGLAWIAASRAELERAATLQGAAEARLASSGAVLDAVELEIHDETRAAISTALGGGCEEHLAFGGSLDDAQALEYSLRL